MKRYADTREPITLPRPAVSKQYQRTEEQRTQKPSLSKLSENKYFAFLVLLLSIVKTFMFLLIPDAKARLCGFCMFNFCLPLDEDFFYGVSIL